MARKVSGPGIMGSTKAVKKQVSNKGGSVKFIDQDGITVRFLTEPDEFYGYYEHYDTENGYQPCYDGECCADGNKRTFRYLVNAYVVDEQKVQAVKIPTTLAEQLVAYYDKYGTLLDRDYDLNRSGTGMNDTRYLAAPDAPSKMRTARFKLLDLEDILQGMLDNGDDDDDDDDEDEPPRRKRSKPRRTRDEDIYDDEDEDEDDDDDPDDGPDHDGSYLPRSRRRKSSTTKKKKRRYEPSGLDEFADDEDDEDEEIRPRRRTASKKKSTANRRRAARR